MSVSFFAVELCGVIHGEASTMERWMSGSDSSEFNFLPATENAKKLMSVPNRQIQNLNGSYLTVIIE